MLQISSSVQAEEPGAEADLRDSRRQLLLLTLPLLGLLALVSIPVIAAQPVVWMPELVIYAAGATVLGLTALMLRYGRISAALAAVAAPAISAGLIIVRILTLFLSGHFDIPGNSFFMPVFACLPLLYLLCFVFLDARWSSHVVGALWLCMALMITLLSLPYWQEHPVRSSLLGLMLLVWIGHGLFALLFSAGVRRQEKLLNQHIRLAESERHARAAMSESESRFRRLFDLASVSINVTDENGRYVMVNQGMVDFLGYTREELLQLDVRAVTVSSDVAEGESLIRQLAAGEIETFRVEKRYRRKDGAIVYAEIFVRELDHVPDQLRRFICVGLDITERKRAEERALESRRIRDFHFDNTPLAVVEFTSDLFIKRWSRRAEKIFGWSEAEAVGRTAEQLGLLSPAQFEVRSERVGKLFRGEMDQVSAVLPMLHRNGRQLWIEVYNSVTRDAEGQVLTMISMALDVTESQEMLRMLNESEARFRGIFNQAAVGIALLDEQGRWLNVNDKLCEIVGYSMDELLERDFQSITHPDDIERDVLLAGAVMDRSIDQYNMEKRYIRKDGETVWVMLFVRRLEATAYLPARFVSVVEDITERKQAESQIKALASTLEIKVAERTRQLREVVRAGQRRNDELTLITDMSRLLAASTDVGEAGQVVTRFLPRIFPQAEGTLYLEGRRQGQFERQVYWGHATPGQSSFALIDCWALRGGAVHHVEGEPDSLHCPHVSATHHAQPHICVPIQVFNQPIGLIELAWGRSTDGWAPEMPLVNTVAEKIGLAFGNLRLREELSRQALIDPLTGLHNRRWLETCLKERVARHARGGLGFAVLIIDIDHFKAINDRYGHEAGDAALQEIARVLGASVRDSEASARLGGEEFTILVDTQDFSEAMAVAERVRLSVQALRIRANGQDLPTVTVSIGVALYPHHGSDVTEVLGRADEALYASKHNGRNQARLPAPTSLAIN